MVKTWAGVELHLNHLRFCMNILKPSFVSNPDGHYYWQRVHIAMSERGYLH
jgi:hypothetical protein